MILVFSILFSVLALPALGELTVEDLDKIRSIVKESEKQTKEHIDLKISSVEKQITPLTNFVYGLIALIVLAVGIPQILMALRSRTDQSLEKQIETLTQEIETLKQQRIVQP